ncbi:Apoptosis-inducing factor [Penicillium rolfsii]|nr:Apoptosis-inducing factor [Penicillium rolfsii]
MSDSADNTTPRPFRKEAVTKYYDVLIIGGSYGGMSALLTLLSLKDGQDMPLSRYGNFSHLRKAPQIATMRVTLLDKRDGFSFAYTSPREANHMWIPYSQFSRLDREDVIIIQGTASRVDTKCQEVLFLDNEDKKRVLRFDYLIIATGICRKWPISPDATEKSAFLEETSKFAKELGAARDQGVVVIGGGAVGIEFSGKIKTLYPETQVTLIHSGKKLLSREALPGKFKCRALELLQEQGVTVLLSERPKVTTRLDRTFHIELLSYSSISAGEYPFKYHCPLFSTMLVDLKLNFEYRQRVLGDSDLFNRLFAAGDVTEGKGIKLAGSAMVTGAIAGANVYSLLLVEERKVERLTMESRAAFYHQPRMALSVGKNFVCYAGRGSPIFNGEELAEKCFGNDMGWQSQFLSSTRQISPD